MAILAGTNPSTGIVLISLFPCTQVEHQSDHLTSLQDKFHKSQDEGRGATTRIDTLER